MRPLVGLAVLCALLGTMRAPPAGAADLGEFGRPGARAVREVAQPPVKSRKPRLRRLRGTVPHRSYTLATTWQHATANLEVTAIAVATAAYFSINDWAKGHARSFHVQREGWFGRDSYAGGMDKLGHFYSASLLSDVFTWTLRRKGFDAYESAASGAIMSWLLMGAIEIGDGFVHYGFSFEDITFNTLGAGFSFLRNTVPGLKEKLDFRLEYLPTNSQRLSANDDYGNKKFLFALKLGGFDELKDTPWRFVELHAGYFARGFSDSDRALGRPLERNLYAGVGLNLSEILLGNRPVRNTLFGEIGRFTLEHLQVPYTSINTRY
jgi:hypothetical protein